MRIQRLVSIVLLAALLASVPNAAPATAATVGPVAGAARAAEPFAPKWLRKLIDYVACIGSIVVIKDEGSTIGAVAVCGAAAKAWYDE